MRIKKNKKRLIRHIRIRESLIGTQELPRLNIFRSLKNISAQIINDKLRVTLLSISTKDKEIRARIKYGGNIKAAAALGEALAQKASDKGIKRVCFDRGGYLYHGRIKALAEAARKAGLGF